MEVERRKLYLLQACSTLSAYAKQLGLSKDAARKRVKVARIATVIPQVFDELEQRHVHLTVLYMLARVLTPKNARGLLAAARGQGCDEAALLIASRFPKPDVPDRIREIGDPAPPLPLGAPAEDATGAAGGTTTDATSAAGATTTDADTAGVTSPAPQPAEIANANPLKPLVLLAGSGLETTSFDRIEPLSGKSYSIQLTASAQLVAGIQRLRELLSHAIPSGALGLILERAVAVSVKHETKRLNGADQPRKQRKQKPNSRHVPVKVQRAVRERDQDRCTFVDSRGVRCEERCFLTVEHNDPWARTRETTPENCCLLCAAHNLLRAKQVFGEGYIAKKIAESKLTAKHRKVESALRSSGYKPREAKRAAAAVSALVSVEADLPTLLRAALQFLGM